VAVGSRTYGMEPGGETAASTVHLPGCGRPAVGSAPIILAGDGASPDPVAADALGGGLPASGATDEIPAAQNQQNDSDPLDPSQPASTGDQNSNPDANQDPQDPQQLDDTVQSDVPPRVYSLQDFINQGMDESPLGVELREDCSKLETNEQVCGLAVLEVRKGSPAANAGIKPYTALAHDLLDGATVAAALVFPPAIIAVAVIDQSSIGEAFDLVIGVDGRRVRHILDFQDLTSNVRPGDILYLTIVRSGKRLQLPVHIPSDLNVTAVQN
jgi:PDZ domain